MQHPKNIVELKDVTTSDPETIIPMKVKEDIPTVQQGEIGQSSRAENRVSNPNPEALERKYDTVGT
jgi:hypothetical protein